MRLKEEQIDLLKTTLKNLSQNAKVYLFGSRVDDTKRGGAGNDQFNFTYSTVTTTEGLTSAV